MRLSKYLYNQHSVEKYSKSFIIIITDILIRKSIIQKSTSVINEMIYLKHISITYY